MKALSGMSTVLHKGIRRDEKLINPILNYSFSLALKLLIYEYPRAC